MRIKLIILITILALTSNLVKAQEDESKTNLDVGTDIVSSYVWRGLSFDPSLNLQPWIAYSVGNFTLGTWGSFNTAGTYLEPDVFLSYSTDNFSATITDIHGGFGLDYFNFKNDETLHIGEFMLQYIGGEKFPITLTASALIYGADKKIESIDATTGDVLLSTDNNYSMYFEIGYSLMTSNEIKIDLFSGVVPSESYFYAVENFSLINAGLKVSKSLKINDSFSLPINLSIISNPSAKSMFYVFGISL